MKMEIKDKRLEGLQEEFEAKEKELEQAQKQLAEKEQQRLHLQADFENAKKRWLKTQAEFQERAHEELLKEFLEIFDDFERASSLSGEADLAQLQEGLSMMSKRLEAFLKGYGVTPMEAQGKLFDPHAHEAVAHEARSDCAESTVLEELRKGYWVNGRVLRPAVVKVSTKPASEVKPGSESGVRSEPAK